jgi:hypothetical protein
MQDCRMRNALPTLLRACFFHLTGPLRSPPQRPFS